MYQRLNNYCAVCGCELQPFDEHTFTAHEFNCYERHPEKIPARDFEHFQNELAGKHRSEAAFRGVETRRRLQGKRAPRKL